MAWLEEILGPYPFDTFGIVIVDGEFDGDYTRDDVTAAYGWMARYVRQFLDAYLIHYRERMPGAAQGLVGLEPATAQDDPAARRCQGGVPR